MKNLLTNLRVLAKRVFAPEEYKKFLELAARFPNLNLYNLLLLHYQMPTAKLVAGQNAWKDSYGLGVKEDARAISLLKPTLVDEAETTIGYAQIGVFDISQLVSEPEIKKEEFSIPEFLSSETGIVFVYDVDDILGDNEYAFLDDELLVKRYEHLSEEENEQNAHKQILCAYIDRFYKPDDETPTEVRGKIMIQSVKYILCARYNLPLPQLSAALIANCKPYGLDLLVEALSIANEVIDKIENRDSVELNFAEIAFINLLVEANSKEEYDSIMEYEIQGDDNLLDKSRESFVEKISLLNNRDFNKIFEDRENNKMLTQPPYRIKLIEEC